MSALAILTKCPLANCPLANCPLANCPLVNCPLAKCLATGKYMCMLYVYTYEAAIAIQQEYFTKACVRTAINQFLNNKVRRPRSAAC